MMNLWWLKNFCFSFYYKKSETSKHDKSVLENKSSWLAEKWRNKHLISDFHTFTWLFLGGLIASDCFLIRIMAYSGIITNNRQTRERNNLPLPTRAPNTKRMQESIQASIAVRPSALGVLVVTVLKMLTSTRNKVTSRAILPGIMSGGTTKLNGEEFYCCFHINVFIWKSGKFVFVINKN